MTALLTANHKALKDWFRRIIYTLLKGLVQRLKICSKPFAEIFETKLEESQKLLEKNSG